MKHKKSRKRLPKVVAKTLVALIFSVFFLLPIVLTITNSFMSSTEISANYGKVFSSVDDTKVREYIGEKVNLKFIPDMVSFEQYWNVLLKSPDYLLKFWNSVLYVVPITVFQLVVASLAAYSFTRFSGKKKTIFVFCLYCIDADAIPGNTCAKLSGFQMVTYFKYKMGGLASGNYVPIQCISADKIYEADTDRNYRGSKNGRGR